MSVVVVVTKIYGSKVVVRHLHLDGCPSVVVWTGRAIIDLSSMVDIILQLSHSSSIDKTLTFTVMIDICRITFLNLLVLNKHI